MLYLNICRLISVDISQGYLFRATRKAGHVSDKPFIGSSVYNRFKQYLNPIQTGLFWSICDWGGAPRTPPLYLWNQQC